jgi:hypothetical protein
VMTRMTPRRQLRAMKNATGNVIAAISPTFALGGFRGS